MLFKYMIFYVYRREMNVKCLVYIAWWISMVLVGLGPGRGKDIEMSSVHWIVLLILDIIAAQSGRCRILDQSNNLFKLFFFPVFVISATWGWPNFWLNTNEKEKKFEINTIDYKFWIYYFWLPTILYPSIYYVI